MSTTLMVPVSIGEALDKITILEIKDSIIKDESKLKNVRAELKALRDTIDQELGALDPSVQRMVESLREVNRKLWDVEDEIRNCESASDFGATFVQLARSVYVTNDERAAIKKQINEALGSALVEEKSYHQYQK